MIHRYYHPALRKHARLFVLAGGSAQVLVERRSHWFTCSQDAADWLLRRGFSKCA